MQHASLPRSIQQGFQAGRETIRRRAISAAWGLGASANRKAMEGQVYQEWGEAQSPPGQPPPSRRTWQGSIPGKRAQVGLMRLFCGRLRAASTTCVLKLAS